MHIPQDVYNEVVVEGARLGYEDAHRLRRFLTQQGWEPQPLTDIMDPGDVGLERGERAAITLALQLKARLLLMDERRGREVARRLGISVRGSLGVLVAAYRQQYLTAEMLRLYFGELKERHDVWISPGLIEKVEGALFAELN